MIVTDCKYNCYIINYLSFWWNSNKSIITSIQDLYSDSNPLQLGNTSFMFALNLVNEDGVPFVFDDTYLSLSIQLNKGYKGKTLWIFYKLIFLLQDYKWNQFYL